MATTKRQVTLNQHIFKEELFPVVTCFRLFNTDTLEFKFCSTKAGALNFLNHHANWKNFQIVEIDCPTEYVYLHK